MNFSLNTNYEFLLPLSQQTTLKELKGSLKDIFIYKLLVSGEGIHIEIATLALDIIQKCQETDLFFKEQREHFFSSLLIDIDRVTKKTLEKVLKITQEGFFKQLLKSTSSIKKNYRTPSEIHEIVDKFYLQTLPALNENKTSKQEEYLKQTYDQLMGSSNYLSLSKLTREWIVLLDEDKKWKEEVYEHFFDLLNLKYDLDFDDFEKNELSKVIFSLHSPYRKTFLKKCTKVDINEYLNLCLQLKNQGGEDVLTFCIASLNEDGFFSFDDLIRGLNLLLSQVNSEGFFENISQWMREKILWKNLIQELEVKFKKNRREECDIEDDIKNRIERFKNSPEVKQPLSDADLALIEEQYRIIDGLCQKYHGLEFNQLINQAHEIREKAKSGAIDLVHRLELIAIARLTISIEFGIYPYSTQILALLGLFANDKNRQAQVKTGEGKSIIVALFAFVMAMECRSVDIITSARYLAIRDHDKFSNFFQRSGVTTGHICYDNKTPKLFKPQILYAPAFDFEFAWMEDLLWGTKLYEERLKNPYISRNFDVVCVDESDNLLIDCAQNGARLAYPKDESFEWVYPKILSFVQAHKNLVIENPKNAIAKLHMYLKDTIEGKNQQAIHQISKKKLRTWMESAYKALFKYNENNEYVLNFEKKDKKRSIQIVDLPTGRISDNSRWSHGLHEFLEVKHDMTVQKESITPITMSHAVFYKFYQTIKALTGTTEKIQTERIYQIDSFDVPPHHPSQRKDLPAIISKSEKLTNCLIVQKTRLMIEANRPTLILCPTIAETEKLSNQMKSENIHFQLLNEIQEEQEQCILTKAGNPGQVTIATNNAGRGTDIILSQESIKRGGLHVLLTFYPNSKRVEEQAIGRAGRQGQPGSSQMILNREDLESNLSINDHKHILTDCEIIQLLNLQRENNEKSQANINIKLAEVERFLAKKTDKFFKYFQQWINAVDSGLILEKFAEKLTAFNIHPNKKLNFDKLPHADLEIAEEFLSLLTKKSDMLNWKIFLRDVVERMKKNMINEWVTLFFEPAEEQLKVTILHLNSKEFCDDNRSFENVVQKTQSEIDRKFEDFRPKWEKYLAKDCSGVFVYLNEITTINLYPVLLT